MADPREHTDRPIHTGSDSRLAREDDRHGRDLLEADPPHRFGGPSPPTSQPFIVVPDMCQTHQRLLLDQAGIGPDGPWRSTIIAAQIALFHAATADPTTYDRIGGDVTRIGDLGCLACDRPDALDEIVAAFQRGGIADVKRLGEGKVAAATSDVGCAE